MISVRIFYILDCITRLYNKFYRLPKFLLLLIVINSIYGFVLLYSAGKSNIYPWAMKQIINFLIFFPVMILIALTNIRTIYKYSYVPIVLVLFLLIIVELFGYTAMGATRWLSVGPLRIQPSELAKISIVLFLAKYFHDLSTSNIRNIFYLVIPSIISIFCSLLIIKQPDLGTGVIIIIVSAVLFFVAGAKMQLFYFGFISICASVPLIWNKLHDYQKKRIAIFIDPEQDPLGSGYNIIQSKIAIGSGGLFGMGIGEGSQSHLSFLPEHQTDFIFACLCEDLGFVGALALIMLYAMITYLSLSISINTKSLYIKLVACGAISIFFFHGFINISMVTGMLPVVGIPLPLMSYGGTMMGSMLIGFGLIMNAHINRSVKL